MKTYLISQYKFGTKRRKDKFGTKRRKDKFGTKRRRDDISHCEQLFHFESILT